MRPVSKIVPARPTGAVHLNVLVSPFMKETLYGFVGTVGITQENGQTLVHDPLKPFLHRGA